jgi:iron complex transport system substrate-binding protein
MIALPRGPQRIVCLTEETTETLYLLGEQDRIVGISGFTVRPAQARREKPKVSAFTSAKIDRILELKPDLVFAFSDLQAEIAADLARRCTRQSSCGSAKPGSTYGSRGAWLA